MILRMEVADSSLVFEQGADFRFSAVGYPLPDRTITEFKTMTGCPSPVSYVIEDVDGQPISEWIAEDVCASGRYRSDGPLDFDSGQFNTKRLPRRLYDWVVRLSGDNGFQPGTYRLWTESHWEGWTDYQKMAGHGWEHVPAEHLYPAVTLVSDTIQFEVVSGQMKLK